MDGGAQAINLDSECWNMGDYEARRNIKRVILDALGFIRTINRLVVVREKIISLKKFPPDLTETLTLNYFRLDIP